MTRAVYRLTGIIGEDAADALAVFLDRNARRPVDVIINSPGGSATEGAALLAAIEGHGDVTVRIQGIAASAASLAAMGGKRIVIHEAATLMIHNPAALTIGEAADHRHTAGVLDGLGAIYAAAYARRTGQPVKRIADLMNTETWMDATEAVALGFADAVERGPAAAPVAFAYDRFENAPARLVALGQRGAALPPTGRQETQQMLDHDKAGTAPATVAEATTPTMTARQASRLHAVAAKAQVPADAVDEIVATAPDFEAGLDRLTAVWAKLGDVDIAMLGPSEAERNAYLATRPVAAVGSDWTGGRALAKKQADALAALVAPHLGLKHEPTMGREFMADTAEATKLRMAHHAALTAGERRLSDREAHSLWMAGTTSTSDYPTIAANSIEVVVARALEQAPIGLRECVHVIPASDWRARNHWSLSGANIFETVNEAGEPKFLVMDERGEALAAPSRKAGFFRATDELLRNSARSLDLELAFARAMIEGANETLRSTIAARIATPGNLSDGVGVFDGTRGNQATGAAALTVSAVSAARTGLARAVDSQGTRKPVDPGIILVAPEQRTAAEQLVAQIAAAELAQVNPFSGRMRVISDPGLAGGAGAHWFVLGDPARFDGLALILMDDMAAPQIEAKPSWTNFGMEWRAHWPMACSWVRPSWFRTEIPGGG